MNIQMLLFAKRSKTIPQIQNGKDEGDVLDFPAPPTPLLCNGGSGNFINNNILG